MTFRGRAEHQPTEKGSANWSARVLERESRELATPTIMFPQRARVAVSLDCKYFRWSTGVFVQQEIREHLGSGRTKIIGITVLVLGLVLLGLFVLDSNSPGTTGLLHGDGSSSPQFDRGSTTCHEGLINSHGRIHRRFLHRRSWRVTRTYVAGASRAEPRVGFV